MFDYIVQDRFNGKIYGLYIEDGLFNWAPSTQPYANQPVFRDTYTGLHYKIYIEDNVFNWEPTHIVRDDSVKLYDPHLNVYWKLFIDDNVFQYDITTPPAASSGLYPVEKYYDFLREKNVSFTYSIKGRKQFKAEQIVPIRGRRSFYKEIHLGCNGRRSFQESRIISSLKGRVSFDLKEKLNLRGKSLHLCERRIEIKGQRDISPILEALDIL